VKDEVSKILAVEELRSLRRAEFWSASDDVLFTREHVAAVRHMSEATLEVEAMKGGGVPYIRIGRRALYRKRDVLAWLEANGRRVENTAQLRDE